MPKVDPAKDLFSTLLDAISGFPNVIREVEPALESPRMLMLRFREDTALIDDFVEVISDQLVNYAVPLQERRHATESGTRSSSGGDFAAASRLRRYARSLLIQYNAADSSRYGEIGELISYCIAVHFLKAAQIGSKMALKTSSEMPVHGVDGLHVRMEDDGSATFFVLESKVTPSATDATREFCKSVAKYQNDRSSRENELRIVTGLSNLDVLEGDARLAAKAYFNLYTEDNASLRRRERSVGTLVYEHSAYKSRLPVDDNKPIDIHEKNAMNLCSESHARIALNLRNHATAAGIDLGKCVVFMLAIPKIEYLKSTFAELNDHVRD